MRVSEQPEEIVKSHKQLASVRFPELGKTWKNRQQKA